MEPASRVEFAVPAVSELVPSWMLDPATPLRSWIVRLPRACRDVEGRAGAGEVEPARAGDAAVARQGEQRTASDHGRARIGIDATQVLPGGASVATGTKKLPLPLMSNVPLLRTITPLELAMPPEPDNASVPSLMKVPPV
jgi:hypothetical protein